MTHPYTLLYLTESDTLRAGAGDMAGCAGVMAEVMRLLVAGDYVMGGPSRNQHGLKLYFPQESPFSGMPLARPDKRFMALAGYLGGRFHVCGAKWYGSNPTNRQTGLPRAMHIIILNNPDTGAPLCILAGNRISAARTGAMVGLGAGQLARPGAATLALVGVGVIGRAACAAVMESCPSIGTIRLYNRTHARAREASSLFAARYGVAVQLCRSIEQAVCGSDIIVYACSGPDKPTLRAAWLLPGALAILPAECLVEPECFASSRLVVDNWAMFEVYAGESASGGRNAPGPLETDVARDLAWRVHNGLLARESVLELGPIVAGGAPQSDTVRPTLLVLDGMCVEDLAWAHTVYQNALAAGIGTRLPLF